MSKVNNQTVLEVLKKKGSINNAGLFVQAILLGILFILLIMTIFLPVLDLVTKITVSLMLFVMAYNNYKIFKRKGFTWIYIGTGIVLIIISVISKIYGY